ncbi:MAG TPA: UDP-N-acetylmuramoyl-L-alanine--D-glutamate ligase [Clostridiales bacterium]|nr:UDP-N-acetylmuramoyl-L-alanine--D-glutamate ligase [Clostridiales bacterium]
MGKRCALVLGAGKSGLSAVTFLLKKGCCVSLYDDNTEDKSVYDEWRAKGCNLFLGTLPDFNKERFAFAVISPGIPLTHPCAVALRENNIPIWGELEIAARFIKKPIIGITGTNGKTTTTTLIGEILKAAGYRVFIGGNIGVPLLSSLNDKYDYYVVEMSSFQLETIDRMDTTISLFLNLTADHLDRHGSMEGYLAAKGNLAAKQSKKHYTVLNYDDEAIRSLEKITGGIPVFFSCKDHIYTGTSLQNNYILFQGPAGMEQENSIVMPISDIRLPGPHNLENALGAITVAKLLNIDHKVIVKTLKTFAGVEHRLEDVAVIKGVRYVNDSKATNPDAVFKALVSYGDAPILLIAGGRNKGNDFGDLGKLIAEKCKSLILIGEAAADMADAAQRAGLEDVTIVEDLGAAVALAAKKAVKDDIVLLSPANASFDQFDNYEQRGQVFKDIVLKLKRGKTNGGCGPKQEEKAT